MQAIEQSQFYADFYPRFYCKGFLIIVHRLTIRLGTSTMNFLKRKESIDFSKCRNFKVHFEEKLNLEETNFIPKKIG